MSVIPTVSWWGQDDRPCNDMPSQGDPRKWAYKAVPTSPTSPAATAAVEAHAGDAPVRIPLLGARQVLGIDFGSFWHRWGLLIIGC